MRWFRKLNISMAIQNLYNQSINRPPGTQISLHRGRRCAIQQVVKVTCQLFFFTSSNSSDCQRVSSRQHHLITSPNNRTFAGRTSPSSVLSLYYVIIGIFQFFNCGNIMARTMSVLRDTRLTPTPHLIFSQISRRQFSNHAGPLMRSGPHEWTSRSSPGSSAKLREAVARKTARLEGLKAAREQRKVDAVRVAAEADRAGSRMGKVADPFASMMTMRKSDKPEPRGRQAGNTRSGRAAPSTASADPFAAMAAQRKSDKPPGQTEKRKNQGRRERARSRGAAEPSNRFGSRSGMSDAWPMADSPRTRPTPGPAQTPASFAAALESASQRGEDRLSSNSAPSEPSYEARLLSALADPTNRDSTPQPLTEPQEKKTVPPFNRQTSDEAEEDALAPALPMNAVLCKNSQRA